MNGCLSDGILLRKTYADFNSIILIIFDSIIIFNITYYRQNY